MPANVDLPALGLIVAAGVLTALACWLLLFGLLYLVRGEGVRVKNRMKHFVLTSLPPRGRGRPVLRRS